MTKYINPSTQRGGVEHISPVPRVAARGISGTAEAQGGIEEAEADARYVQHLSGSGLLVQYGSSLLSSGVFGDKTITFPTAFGGTPIVMATATQDYMGVYVRSPDATSVRLGFRDFTNASITLPIINWFAVGPSA